MWIKNQCAALTSKIRFSGKVYPHLTFAKEEPTRGLSRLRHERFSLPAEMLTSLRSTRAEMLHKAPAVRFGL
jgi:hypothetical protein